MAEKTKVRSGVEERRTTAPRRMSSAEALGMDRTGPADRRSASAPRRAVSTAEALGMEKTAKAAGQNAAKQAGKKMAAKATGALLGPAGTAALVGYEVGQYGRKNFDTGTKTLDALGISPRPPKGYKDGGCVTPNGKYR